MYSLQDNIPNVQTAASLISYADLKIPHKLQLYRQHNTLLPHF